MAPFLDDMTSSEAVTRMQPAPGPAAGGDELDDLFDYDAGTDDVFRDISPPRTVAPTKNKDTLGLDEAVEVTKKIRAPKPKLDETRLLSTAGIPKLRQRAKKLRLKGKGHEYSDAARLLEMYQLWLDDLFPKARFLDALAMVEREGHKRRMQSMRMEWINEGRPRPNLPEEPVADVSTAQQAPGDRERTPTRLAPIFERNDQRVVTPDAGRPDDDEDLYDATPRAARTVPVKEGEPAPATSIFGSATTFSAEDPEDDLDALLAEAEMENVSKPSVGTTTRLAAPEPNFDDEMEAMAGMEDMW